VLLEDPPERTLPVIVKCAEVAAREGAGIVGLGAMTSVVGDAGVTVAARSPIAVTTGNTYTAATALQGAARAAELMGVEMARATVVVLGATGSIGRICAQLMAAKAARVLLAMRDAAKGQALAAELRAAGALATIEAGSDLDAILPEADILVCVSSAAEALVQPRHLKSGAVVCDVARPRDVSVAVAKERDDVLVIEGGVVRPPGEQVDLGFDFGFPPGTMYACMAETSLLALVGRYENYSLGRELDPAKVEEIAALAELHGYRLAGFRSFERAVAESDIAAIRQRVEARRAAARPAAK
jgi:predicted amino acid dehydrogenase